MSYRALARCYAVLILLVVCLFEQGAFAQTANEASPSPDDFKFEVVSIKLNKNPPFGPWGTGSLSLPDGVHLVGGNTYRILALAYLPEDAMDWKNAIIINAPEWVTSEKYDIDARVADKDLKAWGNQKGHMYEHVYLRAAVRNLLKERYKLQAHLVNTQVPYLSIVVNKNHNKLVAVTEIPPVPEGALSLPVPSGGHWVTSRDEDGNITWKFLGCTMDDLASVLLPGSQLPIQNKTGLEGRYNFQFTTSAQEMAEDQLLSETTGLAKWGIRLQNDKGPGYNLVIDHIERPDAN